MPPRANPPGSIRRRGGRRGRRPRIRAAAGSHADRRARLTVRESEHGLQRDAAEPRGPGHHGRTPRVGEGEAGHRQPPSSERGIRSDAPTLRGTCSRQDRRHSGSERRVLNDDSAARLGPCKVLALLGAGGRRELCRGRDRVRTVRQIAALLMALVTLSAREVSAQLPVRSLRLAVGFGVDTTGSPAREVFDLWRRYLVESSDSVRAGLWSQAERATWQPFDLVAPYVYQGFSDYTVVRLAPAVGFSPTSLITTPF